MSYCPEILIVDDLENNLFSLERVLMDLDVKTVRATRGDDALLATLQHSFALAILDVQMPEMDGYELAEILRGDEKTRRIPIIFLTAAFADEQHLFQGYEAGGVDYIVKPYDPRVLLGKVRVFLELHRYRMQLEQMVEEQRRLKREVETHNKDLSRTVSEQVREISSAQIATIFAMARLAEWRDDQTGRHIDRVSAISGIIARHFMTTGAWGKEIDERFVETTIITAPLHDIGKVGIPDAVLLKPGKLTPREFEQIKSHSVIGAETLLAVQHLYPQNKMLRMGVEVARFHHERWDGAGYPDGLSGETIPRSARILSVADVYDALRSKRPYKEPFSHNKAMSIIGKEAGAQFDPEVVWRFESISDEIRNAFDELSM